ncbi:MAG TPA: FRG domain-containing protein [Gemmatimonas sp.]|uniref:FRG domain-containing protein n=1 Tax=Gemmatimonas sp. TaxID=1962908 RepID=UPI002EDACE20
MTTGDSVFRSLDALQQHLATLPPLQPGWRRVYRGQNRDFGKMIPSGIRRRTREYWSLWHRHAMLVQPSESDLALAEAKGVPSTLDMLSFWVHAIAQHYGGDSNYLDVTGDIQSALWFALYEMVPKDATIVMGPGQEPDPEHDIQVKQKLWRYQPWRDTAYLYVFDVRPWDGKAQLEHGTLVDVATQAPSLVSDSSRMAVQRACLLHADTDIGDLTSFYVCPPLQVAWPMEGADRLQLGTEDIFPPPTVDPWYQNFLRQPLTIMPEPTDDVQYRHPVPIALYLYDTPDIRNNLLARLNMEQPPLASRGLREIMVDDGADDDILARFDAATVIYCEAALQALLQARRGSVWHMPLLMSDLPTTAETRHLLSGEPAGTVDLTNVIFEFSPLEAIATASAYQVESADYVRALWILRNGDTIAIVPFVQQANGPGVSTPPFRVAYDADAPGGLVFYAGDEAIPNDVAAFLATPVRAALFTLRSLADGEKLLPNVLAAFDPKSEAGSYMAGVDAATTTLCLTTSRPFGVPLHVLRQEGEVFFGPGQSTTRMFMLPAGRPFGSIPLDEMQARAQQAR